jgi:uncharacterized RDD family membrane protein YckC
MNEQATKVVGRRVVAFIIDALLITAVNFAVFFAFAQDKVEAAAAGDIHYGDTTYVNITLGDKQYAVFGGKAAIYFLLVLLISLGYFVVWQGLRGVTVGKLMLGLRTVKESDPTQPPGVGRALARWFLYIADGFPYVIPYLTGFVCALVTKNHKRIGDMVGGTLVVKRQAEVSPLAPPVPPAGAPFQQP